MEQGVIIAEHKATEDKELTSTQKLKKCSECPLYIPEDQICNPGLWMHPETGEVSTKAKAGFVRGCGCYMARKVKRGGVHCHIGRW